MKSFLKKFSFPALLLVLVVTLSFKTASVRGQQLPLEISENPDEEYFSVTRGWTKPSKVAKEIETYKEGGNATTLYLIGLLPTKLKNNTVCNYPSTVSTFYKASKAMEPYASFGMIRMVAEGTEGAPDAAEGELETDSEKAKETVLHSYEEQRHLFEDVLNMTVPTDEAIGCFSLLRYNVALTFVNVTNSSQIANPGLIQMPTAQEEQLKVMHLASIMSSSHIFRGHHVNDFAELRDYGMGYMATFKIPLVLFINDTYSEILKESKHNETGSLPDDENSGMIDGNKITESFVHGQIWSTLSNMPHWENIFAFSMTANASLLDLPDDPEFKVKSPTYFAVLPTKNQKITFPFDVKGDRVDGIEIAMASFNKELTRLKDYEKKETGFIIQALDKLREWLDTINENSPRSLRERYHKIQDKIVEEEMKLERKRLESERAEEEEVKAAEAKMAEELKEDGVELPGFEAAEDDVVIDDTVKEDL